MIARHTCRSGSRRRSRHRGVKFGEQMERLGYGEASRSRQLSRVPGEERLGSKKRPFQWRAVCEGRAASTAAPGGVTAEVAPAAHETAVFGARVNGHACISPDPRQDRVDLGRAESGGHHCVLTARCAFGGLEPANDEGVRSGE